MKALVRNGTVMLAFVAGIGAAGAASVRSAGFDGLTDAQRQEIWQGVSKQATNESLPAGFAAAVGETLPGPIKMQPSPEDVSAAVPVLRLRHGARPGSDRGPVVQEDRRHSQPVDAEAGLPPAMRATT